VETIAPALIYGTSFDGLSLLLTINSELQLSGERRREPRGGGRENREIPGDNMLCS